MTEHQKAARPCRKCGTVFSTRQCKVCQKVYSAASYEANTEHKKALMRAWHATNREQENAKKRAWAAENRELKAKRAAIYHANNKEKIAACAAVYRAKSAVQLRKNKAAYYERTKDRHKERNDAWRAAHLQIWRVYSQNRRARKAQNGGELSHGLVEKLFGLQRGKCACCGAKLGRVFDLDHRVPLARGGRNEDGNMQLLTRRCNRQKKTKDPIEFMQERGFLL